MQRLMSINIQLRAFIPKSSQLKLTFEEDVKRICGKTRVSKVFLEFFIFLEFSAICVLNKGAFYEGVSFLSIQLLSICLHGHPRELGSRINYLYEPTLGMTYRDYYYYYFHIYSQ